jgi:hypothetical protein
MKHNNRYIYPTTKRELIDGQRHYDINNGKWKLPSVTTILKATEPQEKQDSLAESWNGDAQDIREIYPEGGVFRPYQRRKTGS